MGEFTEGVKSPAQCGVSVKTHARIEAAKPKIVVNKDSVLTVALEVGFNARSSFYKAFKHETGKPPSEFRKQYSTTLNSVN